MPKRCVKLNYAIQVVIVKKRFEDKKMPVTLCNSSGTNSEMFSYLMHTNQLQRGCVVDNNEMLTGPFWITPLAAA